MTMMAFKVGSFGIEWFSLGSFTVATTVAGGYQVHTWDGTRSGAVFTQARSARPFVVPYNVMLNNLSGQDFRIKIRGGIFGWGRTNFKFSIRYSSGSRAEAYNIAPYAPDNEIGVDIMGIISDEMEFFGQFRRITNRREASRVLSELFGTALEY